MRDMFWVLDGKTPVATKDLIEWALFFENADRRVSYTEIFDHRISTVFLGLDHSFVGDGKPLIFETMVFPEFSMNEELCIRTSTWDEAEGVHNQVVAKEVWYLQKRSWRTQAALASVLLALTLLISLL